MNQHYYSQKPVSNHHERQWDFTLEGKNFHFTTDNGVFSKSMVDFGSRLLIEAFSTDELPSGTILDVGCGYGPIGLAIAARYPSKQLELVDINERAIELAKKNSVLNQVKNVTIHQSDLYATVLEKTYAAILSNPPIRAGKKIVHQILTDAFPLLSVGGSLTIVIQKKQGAPSAAKKMEEIFGNVSIVARRKGYLVLQSIKRER